MKKFFSLVVLLAVMCLPSWAWAKTPDKDIIILYTNDVHCGVDQNLGYAGFAFCAEEARKHSPYVTLVDAGDFAQGETIGAISQGRYIIEIMNAIGYDIAVPGNHEFDYGWSQFENFAKNLKCGFIACNIRDLRTGKLVFKPYRILTYGDVKVAYVGATTPESITKSIPYYFTDDKGNFIYGFDGDETGEKLIDSIQKAVNDARADGADYVIVVGHLGEYDNITERWSSPFIAARTKGIDAFIDGHSHEVTPELHVTNADSKDVIITQSGTKLNYVGKLTITADGKLKSELLNNFDGRDKAVKKVVDDIKARYDGTLREHLCYTSFDLNVMDEKGTWLLRNNETNMCNLVLDSLLSSAKGTKTGNADIAFLNAGAMRTNVKAGEMTRNSALSVLPFNNTVCISEISGQTILDELEHGARLMPTQNGGLLHVAGMTYTIDATIPSPVIVDENNMFMGISGDRRVKDVKVNGEPIDPAKKYKVASASYVIYQEGDGHIFKGAKIIEPDYLTTDAVFANYLREFDYLPERYRNAEGRIKIVK